MGSGGPGQGMARRGSSVDTLAWSKPTKSKCSAGRHARVYQQLLLCITFSQLLPARVPSGKPGACKAQLSIPEDPKAADKQVDTPAHRASLSCRVWPLCSCGKCCLEPAFSSPVQLSPAMARSNLTTCFFVADSPSPAFAPTAQRTCRGTCCQILPTNLQKHPFRQV